MTHTKNRTRNTWTFRNIQHELHGKYGYFVQIFPSHGAALGSMAVWSSVPPTPSRPIGSVYGTPRALTVYGVRTASTPGGSRLGWEGFSSLGLGNGKCHGPPKTLHVLEVFMVNILGFEVATSHEKYFVHVGWNHQLHCSSWRKNRSMYWHVVGHR